MDASSLFARPFRKAGEFLYVGEGGEASLANWDALAVENPVNAAIAQDDESGELKKGAHEYAALAAADLPDGAVVLDLGCGYGRVAKHVLPKRRFGLYLGFDDSMTMLSAFAERHGSRPEERTTPLALVKGKIDALPFRDASMDCVITSAVWLHNPKDVVRRSIAEVRRVLKPGGTLYAWGSFPNGRWPHGWQERFYTGIILPLLGRADRNGPVRTYSGREVRRLFEGFADVRIERFGCTPLSIHLLILPRMLNFWTWKQFAMRFNRLVCRLAGRRADMFAAYFDVIARR